MNFSNDDRSAVNALELKRQALPRARKMSPALVPILENEIATCEAALAKAREAGLEHERESVELSRAEAQRRQALIDLNTSAVVAPDAAREIVLAAETAKYLEGARKRRADAARDEALSAYGRVSKDIAARNAAVQFAERLAGAIVDRDEGRIPAETRPEVIGWLPLVFPVEGRAAYVKSHAYRDGHPSYDRPPPVSEYERACERFFAAVERTREKAAQLATDLDAVTREAEG